MSHAFFILGAGGHAKVVVDALLRAGHSDIRIFDDDPTKLNTFLLGYALAGSQQDLIQEFSKNHSAQVVIAVGQNKARFNIYKMCMENAIALGNAIHPNAVIASAVHLGQGLMIMAGAIINSDAYIHDNVIVNTGAVIEHDCLVGSHSHIAPHATLCGGVQVGELALIGAGAIVLPGVKIGESCIVGAGAVVNQDIPAGKTAVGIPARLT